MDRMTARRALAIGCACVTLFAALSSCGELDIKARARSLAAPAAPGGVTATATAKTSVRVAWKDLSDNETGFMAERSKAQDTGYATVGTTAADIESIDDSGLEAGTTYWYRVRSSNAAGESTWSTPVSAKTVMAALLTINTTTGGTASAPDLPDGQGIEGQSYAINATPETGYEFTEWSVVSGAQYQIGDKTKASTSIVMNAGDVTLKANFALKTYTLTLQVNQGPYGSVTCDSQYPSVTVSHGTSHDLVATPNAMYSFTGWKVTQGSATIGNANALSTTITVTSSDTVVFATFEKTWEYSLIDTENPGVDFGSRSAVAINPTSDEPLVAYYAKGSSMLRWMQKSEGLWSNTFDIAAMNDDDLSLSFAPDGTPWLAFRNSNNCALLDKWDSANSTWGTVLSYAPGTAGEESWSPRGAIGFSGAAANPFMSALYGPGMSSNPPEVGLIGYSAPSSYNRVAQVAGAVMDIRMYQAGGTIHLAYRSGNAYYYQCGTSFPTQNTSTLLPDTGNGAKAFDLVVSPAGTRYFFWVDGGDGALHCARSIDGENWSYDSVDISPLGDYPMIQAKMDKDGRPFVLSFDSTSNSAFRIAWATSAGWGTEQVINATGPGNAASSGSLAIDSSYRVHVLYYDGFNKKLRYALRLPISP